MIRRRRRWRGARGVPRAANRPLVRLSMIPRPPGASETIEERIATENPTVMRGGGTSRFTLQKQPHRTASVATQSSRM
jgi:hypothetical protein